MTTTADARARLDAYVTQWDVTVTRIEATATSLFAFGTRLDQPVVLKIVQRPGDEWHAGRVVAAFDGNGVVCVLEHDAGAVLLEQLRPGTPLVTTVTSSGDETALAVLAQIVTTMSQAPAVTNGYATAEDWAAAFDSYLVSGDAQIPPDIVEHASKLYRELCRTQTSVRLLHGDLQHYNVLRDTQRGWVAIDPKGVVAETEFEFGAALRNPHGTPNLYARAAIERRIDHIAGVLSIDADRTAAWTFAQAVLSAIWTVEDEGRLDRSNPALAVALALQPAH